MINASQGKDANICIITSCIWRELQYKVHFLIRPTYCIIGALQYHSPVPCNKTCSYNQTPMHKRQLRGDYSGYCGYLYLIPIIYLRTKPSTHSLYYNLKAGDLAQKPIGENVTILIKVVIYSLIPMMV